MNVIALNWPPDDRELRKGEAHAPIFRQNENVIANPAHRPTGNWSVAVECCAWLFFRRRVRRRGDNDEEGLVYPRAPHDLCGSL
jgi:hypothetical protein